MLPSTPISLLTSLLLATPILSAPLLAPRQGTGITVYVPNPNDPMALTPVTTLAPMLKLKEKRQEAGDVVTEYAVNDPLNPDVVTEYAMNDPLNPNDDTPIRTYVQSGPSPTPTPETPGAEPALLGTDENGVVKVQGGTPPEAPATAPVADGSIVSDGQSILSVINYWRRAYGVGELIWGTDLAAAAANTGQRSGGSSASMVHQPMDKQTAEVIGPGNDNAFGKDLGGRSSFEVTLAKWLCERPSDILGDLCAWQQGIMKTAPPIGGDPAADHKKLVDDKYKRIGCAFTRGPDVNGYWGQGLWVCDLKGE